MNVDASPQPVLAEVAVEPAQEGEGHGKSIAEAMRALRGQGVRVEPGPMSTVVQGGLHEVLEAVERAHDLAARRAERVVTNVRLESRKDGIDLEQRRQET